MRASYFVQVVLARLMIAGGFGAAAGMVVGAVFGLVENMRTGLFWLALVIGVVGVFWNRSATNRLESGR